MIERKSWAPWFREKRILARQRPTYSGGFYVTDEGEIPLAGLDWRTLKAVIAGMPLNLPDYMAPRQ